ncbi:MAG TPA: DUF3105 domain-containing protein [Thermoleophilaceae bacterium]|nr:DUF3105 domain-containing protein [Thermoleophilaceae bacterium]
MSPGRSDAERAESDRRRIRQLIGLGVAGVAALVIWILALTTGSGGGTQPNGGSAGVYPKEAIPAPRERSLERAAAAAGCELRSFPSYGGGQTTARVSYRTNPPTSGRFNPEPAADGIYDLPPATEKLVHSLANGRIVFQFSVDAGPKLRGQLKALVLEDPRQAILTLNQTSMPFVVAATAWRHYIGCRDVRPAMFDALRDFRVRYGGRTP